MARRTFQLRTTLPVDPVAAIEHQVGLAAHVGVHPYVRGVEVRAQGSDGEHQWVDYRVHERPTAFGIPYNFRFPVRMIRLSPTAFRSHVRAAPGCRLLIESSAAPAPGGCTLSEEVLVEAPLPLVGYVARRARQAHTQAYARLPEVLTGGPAGNT